MPDQPDNIDIIADFNPLLEVLIAQLHLRGVLDDSDLSMMAKRLRECDRPDLAMAVLFLPTANAHDAPHERRAAIHVIHGNKVPAPDGGKDSD